jgi:hypothetical protein
VARIIPLTQGRQTIVDDADYEWLSQHKWFVSKVYAARWTGSRQEYMHREIMQPGPTMQVDHIDHDTLNNQRANLRLTTGRGNSRNRKPAQRRDGSPRRTPYKGVSVSSYTPKSGKPRYKAVIHPDGNRIFLGSFATPEEAARAYNDAARKHYGEFAWLNDV